MPKRRRVKLTPEEHALLSRLGAIGGNLSSKHMTKEQRKARGSKAIAIRWEKERARTQKLILENQSGD